MMPILSSNAKELELEAVETRGHGERPISRRSVSQRATTSLQDHPQVEWLTSTRGREGYVLLFMVVPSDSGMGPFVTFRGDHRTNN